MALTVIERKQTTSLNKKTNIRYIYDTTVYFDDELGRKVSKRKLIAKIDPETGEEVRTGRRRSVPVIPDAPDAGVKPPEQMSDYEGEIRNIMAKLAALSDSLLKLKELIGVLEQGMQPQ